jgi:hypothetical protein
LNLTINYSNTGTDVQTASDSYTWIDGNTYTASNNTAIFTLTNQSGCDSIVTLNLTINYTTTGIDVQTACDNYTWIDGNTYTASNNTATHVLVNAAGVDSIVTLNLTINYGTTATYFHTACGSYTWIDGITYTNSTNTPTFTLTTTQGCDSVITLFLTINNVDVSVTENNPVLTANASGAAYVWLNCDNNFQPITGNTAQSFTATQTGSYAVEIEQNGCVDTSLCYSVIVSGVEDEADDAGIQIYPNPSAGVFAVKSDYQQTVTIEVTDVLGKLVSNTYPIAPGLNMIDASDWSKGLYFIKTTNGDKTKVQRLVLN